MSFCLSIKFCIYVLLSCNFTNDHTFNDRLTAQLFIFFMTCITQNIEKTVALPVFIAGLILLYSTIAITSIWSVIPNS